MKKSFSIVAIAAIAGLAVLPAKADTADTFADIIITLIDPAVAMIIFRDDCGGKLTVHGKTAIKNFRKNQRTRTFLKIRVDAWRKHLRSQNQARKCKNVSQYLTKTYAKKLVVLSSG